MRHVKMLETLVQGILRCKLSPCTLQDFEKADSVKHDEPAICRHATSLNTIRQHDATPSQYSHWVYLDLKRRLSVDSFMREALQISRVADHFNLVPLLTW